MSVNEEAAEVLEKAADGFESGRYGWTRGLPHRKDSEGTDYYCATGALHREAGLEHLPSGFLGTPECNIRIKTYKAADDALGQAVETTNVPGWNDYFAGSMQEVIEKMKEAAKKLRNGELT